MFWKCVLFFFLLDTIISFAQINNNLTDYLIISPVEFNQILDPLVKHREKKGFSVKITNVEDIYKSYKNLKPQFAIREYISTVLNQWDNAKLMYVLIIGDTELIPSYRIKSMFSVKASYNEDSVAIDDWYVTNLNEEDKLPDAAIGRIPIKNNYQLSNVISKIISFETSLSRENYSDDILFISDKTDAYFFEAETEKLSNKFNQVSFRTKRVDFNEESKFAGTKLDLLNEIKNGAIFYNYNGHGAPKQWSKLNIFSINDFDSLFKSTKPGIFTSLACSQNFDIKNDSSIVEKLMLFPQGGAIATIAPSGIGMSNDGSRFISKFYDIILGNINTTLGEAILKIKRETITTLLPNDAICRRFTLLGDPALTLPQQTISAVADLQQPENTELLQNYPNPFNSSTIIKYNIWNTSNVSLKIFNALGEVVDILINNEIQSPGQHQVSFDASKLPSGIYFYNLAQGNLSFTKKMILIK